MEYHASLLPTALDDLKPSLFELLAETQLSALLPPTLRYLLAISTPSNPRFLLPILNSFDEAYALLNLALQHHFLTSQSASFTESFYGLRRERALPLRPPTGATHALPRAHLGASREVGEALRLRRRDVWRNLLVLVGLPYVARKASEHYDIHIAPSLSLSALSSGGPTYTDANSLPPSPTLRQRLWWWYKWFLRRVYPALYALSGGAALAFQLAYLFGASRFHDPLLWVANTHVRRMSPTDVQPVPAPRPKLQGTRPSAGTSLMNPKVLTESVVPTLLSGTKLLLPAGVFALKFLEWWHASDFARQLARKAGEGVVVGPPALGVNVAAEQERKQARAGAESAEKVNGKQKVDGKPNPVGLRHPIAKSSGLPIFTVPPPVSAFSPGRDEEAARSGSEEPQQEEQPATDACPICKQSIATPTASPSGYVYCYQCIHRWVEGTHDRQVNFMAGGEDEDEDDHDHVNESQDNRKEGAANELVSREGRWESGMGRDAITGMRVLGGTGVLRRVMA